MAVGALGGVIDGIFGIGNTILSNGLAEDREMEARSANYKYGEAAANNAQKRQWETINQFYTPSAQLRQLKEAGLSPSLMYGQGGGSVGSGAAAPQGSGAMGIGPTSFGVPSTNIAQSLSIAAQIESLKADANLKNSQANTEKFKQAQIDLQNKAQELENSINAITKDTTIESIKEKLTLLKNQADLTYLQGLNEKIDYDFKSENFANALKEQELKNETLVQKIIESKSGVKLNEAQTKFIKEQTKWYYDTIRIKYAEVEAKFEQNQNQLDIAEYDRELRKELANIDKEVRLDFNKRFSENAEMMKDVQERGQLFELAGDVLEAGTEIAKQYANPIGTTVEKTAKTIMDGKGNVKGRETTNRQVTTQKGR